MSRTALPLLLLALPLSACLPDVKDDTAACQGPEVCNGVDDDCDGLVDENASDATSWYPDNDGDGYGDPSTTTISCEQPTGYVSEDNATGDNADCDDGDATAYPGATETWYDGTDSDCDGASDYDQDGDGHERDDDGGDDCDDSNADVHPDASEVWYDGTDQDCDGRSDYDQDQDGYDSDEHGGLDCDDTNAAYNPGAKEIWYDGYDQDCDDWSDYDQDQDGHDSDAFSGDDCDDSESTVNPDALEWVDSVDNNCDGDIDVLDLSNAAVPLRGETGGDEAGIDVAGLGDVNNDGYDDILVGAYQQNSGATSGGAAYLLLGPVSAADLSGADARLLGDLFAATAGYSVAAAGDVNGDGNADMLVGAPYEGSDIKPYDYTGAVYLVYGSVSGDLDLSADADARLVAASFDDGAGWAIDGGVDVTGDKAPDLLIGATDASGGAERGGTTYLVSGTVTGELTLDHADAAIDGDQDYEFSGSAVALVEDQNADGFGEVLVGSPSWDDGEYEDVGAAYLFRGPLTGTLSLSDADGTLLGSFSDDGAGDCVESAGDINGDGHGDFLVGAPNANDLDDDNVGVVYLMHGPVTGTGYLLYTNAAEFYGSEEGSSACSAAAPGDMDLDGNNDLLIGAYKQDSTDEDAGGAWLLSGPFNGNIAIDSAVAVFQGSGADDFAGYNLAAAGDTDADGYPDLLVGAPYNDDVGTNAGAAYLLLGSPLLP